MAPAMNPSRNLMAGISEGMEFEAGARSVVGMEGSVGDSAVSGVLGFDSAVVVSGEEERLSGGGSGEGIPEGVVVDVAGGKEVRDLEESCSKKAGQKELIQAGSSLDLVLDIVSSQPLQEMDFIGEQISPIAIERDGGKKDCLMVELNQVEGRGEEGGTEMDEEFPVLNKENLKSVKEREKNRGTGRKRG